MGDVTPDEYCEWRRCTRKRRYANICEAMPLPHGMCAYHCPYCGGVHRATDRLPPPPEESPFGALHGRVT